MCNVFFCFNKCKDFKVVFGAYDFKTGVCGSCADLRNSNFYNHQIQITGGVLLKENQDILQSFFKKIRLKKN